jgi:hypothetical protein
VHVCDRVAPLNDYLFSSRSLCSRRTAIDEALADVFGRAHSSLVALHDAVFASSTAQVALAAFATPASARELHGLVARLSLLSTGGTLATAVVAAQVSA